jgi:16S rRNA (cytosine1402-N4)-methyltransferase
MTAPNPLPGGHVPVMLREVVGVLAPRDGAIYVDGTFGVGGYSQALLEAARCTVWGIDRDPEAVERGKRLARNYDGRLTMLAGRYGDMDDLLAKFNVTAVDGVALDLGVSSAQIDDPARGFSFRADGPLDMRMDGTGASAADIVNALDEASLARIIHSYGEERFARQIARAIVAARTEAPIDTTGRLATIIRGVVRQGRDGIDPSTRTFQALRIQVNDELGELDRGLAAAERLLAPGGRLAVVAFHSLEDRKVKRFLKARSAAGASKSRLLPGETPPRAPSFELIAKKALRPTDDEIVRNPRARSARLRAAVRTGGSAWPAMASPAGEGA